MVFSEIIEEPFVFDIVIYKGTSFSHVFDVEQASLETGEMEPTPLSMYKAVGQIFDKDTQELLAEFTSPALKDDGKIEVWLGADDSVDLPVGKNVWGLTLVSKSEPGLDTTTITVGDVDVRRAKYVPAATG